MNDIQEVGEIEGKIIGHGAYPFQSRYQIPLHSALFHLLLLDMYHNLALRSSCLELLKSLGNIIKLEH